MVSQVWREYRRMFSKIYFKALAVTALIIVVYTGVIVFFVSPKIEERAIHLEEKTGKAHLQEIATVVDTTARELKSYEQNSITMHKEELKNITEVAFKLVEALYDSSQPESVKDHIQFQAKALQNNLLQYYQRSQQHYSPLEIQKAIKELIKLYRYDGGTGYFFINRNTSCVIHPIKPALEGRDLVDLKCPFGERA